jgi:hypothetical protein
MARLAGHFFMRELLVRMQVEIFSLTETGEHHAQAYLSLRICAATLAVLALQLHFPAPLPRTGLKASTTT